MPKLRTEGIIAGLAAICVLCACTSSTSNHDAQSPDAATPHDAHDSLYPDSQPVPRPDVSDTSDEAEVETTPAYPDYPLDDQLRLNHIQLKGTHNSYHLLPDELPTPEWNYSHAPLPQQLREMGVRQVELDVHWDAETHSFLVFHVPILDDNTTCETFVECLTQLRSWADANPGHHTLFVLVEPKDDIDPEPIVGHYDDLDAEILSVWPRQRLVTPDDVRGNRASIEEAVLEDGWPTLGQTRDRALFLMLDSGEHKDNYLDDNPTLSARPMFVRGKPGEPWCAFIEIGGPVGHELEIADLVQAGYMVRTASDSTDPEKFEGNPARAAAALNSGAHLISTDFPAPVVGTDFWLDIPGGKPSRCNPINAPGSCTSPAVESLAAAGRE